MICSFCFISYNVLAETRIKDIVLIEGSRGNLLIGQGLVAGLSGTGDNLDNVFFTQKDLTDFFERLGVSMQGVNLRTRNIAAVTVTAVLPPYAKRGMKLDAKISAIGDATSLRGGTLLVTALLGADGNVYAVSQGPVVVSEFNPASNEVRTRSKVIETSGYVQDGAIVEHEIDFDFCALDKVKFTLYNPDFNTSKSVADTINNNIPGNVAKALDAGTIEVTIPKYRKSDMVDFIAQIEQLKIEPDYSARVVIDEASGTVVIGSNVRIRPVAVSQGNLIINVGDFQPSSLGPNASNSKVAKANRFVDQQRGSGVQEINSGSNLSQLVNALNKLGVYPKDIVSILFNIKAAGALDAVIEVR
nr:flagellar basal body P-ring protein FlgI [Candidatus Sarmatiella mevalonica]